MKKAESLSLSTMAIAAIVLVVIIVTIAIFTGVAGDVVPFLKQRTECSSQPGVVTGSEDGDGCYGLEEECSGEKVYGLGCDKKGSSTPYCCIRQD